MQNRTKTSLDSHLGNTEGLLMSYQEDSHVNHTVLQATEEVLKMTDISGRKCLELYGRFSHVLSWEKMLAELLIGVPEWYSSRCVLIWKVRATKFNRLYFQLAPLTHRTEEIGYSLSPVGLLPTPVVMDSNQGDLEKINQRRARAKAKGINGNGFGMTIGEMANRGLLPTPVVMDYIQPKTDKAIQKEMTITRPGRKQLSNLRDVVVRQPERISASQKKTFLPTPLSADSKSGRTNITDVLKKRLDKGLGMRLTDQAQLSMLPTPATRDYKGGNSIKHLTRKSKKEGNSHQDQLPNYIKLQTGQNSQLNPLFVAEMMGFPPDWTLRPFLK